MKWPQESEQESTEGQPAESKNTNEQKLLSPPLEPRNAEGALLCQALCPTSAYYRRGIQPCKNLAAVKFPNGLSLCAKHAGKHMLAQAIKRQVIKCVNTDPNKQPTATKDIMLQS